MLRNEHSCAWGLNRMPDILSRAKAPILFCRHYQGPEGAFSLRFSVTEASPIVIDDISAMLRR